MERKVHIMKLSVVSSLEFEEGCEALVDIYEKI